jgi:ferritin-like metal-binding protein YciE
MKLFSANIEDLRTLYIANMKRALYMEQRITHALPTMIQKATDPQLVMAFESHLSQTQIHLAMVEEMLRRATNDAQTMTCKAINGLVSEAESSIKDASNPAVRDIALINACQQVEHHEIAVYGTLRSWAILLGLPEDADMLDSILREEKQTDKLLSAISDGVNLQTAAA